MCRGGKKESQPQVRNIKRSILESLTSGVRPPARAGQERQEDQQNFGNKVNDVKTEAEFILQRNGGADKREYEKGQTSWILLISVQTFTCGH